MKITFSSLLTLVEKDLKIFFRSRFSSAVIILMPLLIVLFVGYGFGTSNLSGINVATYSDSYSDVSENILNSLQENDFSVRKQNSLEDCIQSVKLSKNQVCIFLPAGLSEEGSEEDVIFYVDYSRMNLAYTLINLIGEEISSEASVLGVNLIQELINNLESAKSSLIEQKLILDSINEEVIDVREIGNSISSPVLELEKIIKDFENHENSSDIDDQIDDLKKIKDQISSNFSNFDEMNVKISGLKLNIDLLVINLDNLINSLNVFEINNAESIIAPFDFKLESINPVDEKREYLIPTIISLIALFGGILISSTLVLKNKKTRAYFRNFVTPTRDITFVFATYLTSLIILLMQFLLVFLGLYFVFDMNFFASSFSILAILVLGCSTFIFIGMFLGYVFKSEETIVFSSVLFASILMFFSNIILPLENISSNLFRIVSFNPLVLVENALKKIYLFGLDFGSILVELTVLGLFLVFFGVLTYFMRRMNKKGL